MSSWAAERADALNASVVPEDQYQCFNAYCAKIFSEGGLRSKRTGYIACSVDCANKLESSDMRGFSEYTDGHDDY